MVRAPSFSSRVKQSCTLVKLVFFASLRSRSENSRHSAMQHLHTQGCSIRLTQPMKRVSKPRGIRLVSRKLMSSCCTMRAIKDFSVMSVSFACNTVRRLGYPPKEGGDQHNYSVRIGRIGAPPHAAQTATARACCAGPPSLAGGPFAHGAPLRGAGAVLRIRRVAVFLQRRRACEHRRGAPYRLHA